MTILNKIVFGYGSCSILYGLYRAPKITRDLYKGNQNSFDVAMLPMCCMMAIITNGALWPFPLYNDINTYTRHTSHIKNVDEDIDINSIDHWFGK